jgi:chorismate-pyruvate lyase
MNMLQAKSLAQCASPGEALDELCSGFSGYSTCAGQYDLVTPDQMPADYRALLVHQRHMTLVLQDHHGVKPNLFVMERRREGDFYGRKIFLTAGNTAPAIELGVVRMNLTYMQELVRREILAGQTPLGAILVQHKVLRRIEPRWFLRFAPGSAVLRWFGYQKEGPFFGRIGTIYCDGDPAIELLEIVTLWE